VIYSFRSIRHNEHRDCFAHAELPATCVYYRQSELADPARPEGSMKNLDDLLEGSQDHVLFSCVAGSRAYGTSTHESDEDIRGLYAVRSGRYLDLEPPPRCALHLYAPQRLVLEAKS
jgi:RNA repair pathway DNA polymerase beta family